MGLFDPLHFRYTPLHLLAPGGNRHNTRWPANGLYGNDSVAVLFLAGMKTLEQVESDVRTASAGKQEELRDWLENILEDQLEFTDEFKAKIERGEQDIREGRSRIRKP